jgi:hypothetical protein
LRRRFLQFIVTNFLADAILFFKKVNVFLKIFLTGAVRNRKMAPTPSQNHRKGLRRHFPKVISQATAPTASPMEQPSRISPRQMRKLSRSHAHMAAATKMASAKLVIFRRTGRKNPYSTPSSTP